MTDAEKLAAIAVHVEEMCVLLDEDPDGKVYDWLWQFFDEVAGVLND